MKIKMLLAIEFRQSQWYSTFHGLPKQSAFTFMVKMLAVANFLVSLNANSKDSFDFVSLIEPNLQLLLTEGLGCCEAISVDQYSI